MALLGAGVLMVLGPAIAFLVGYAVLPVPTPDQVVASQVAVLSYADGTTLTRLTPEQPRRRQTPVDAVPVPVREAVLAAQDRSFYGGAEADVVGSLRSVWHRVRGEHPAPTITQQYLDSGRGDQERSLWRGYRDLVVSIKLAREQSKDQILGDYLDATYFGRGAYGIQAAARAYFGKDVRDLTVAEGAVLAGVIGAPTQGDPAVSPDHGTARWNSVLDGMVAQGWLTPPQRAVLRFPSTLPRAAGADGVPAGIDGHLAAAVVAELAAVGITERDVAQEGLRVTTTIDPTRQHQAVAAARGALAGAPTDTRSALVAVDPQTGGVLAYDGGEPGSDPGSADASSTDPAGTDPRAGDPDGDLRDEAGVARPAGATFTPFALLAGLRHDPPVGPGTVVDRAAPDAPCPHCGRPQAVTGDNDLTLEALTRRIGPGVVTDAARAAGIGLLSDGVSDVGDRAVTALDLASAYATIAADGVWHRPHLVSTVVTLDGHELYRAPTDGDRRFSGDVARGATAAMLGVATDRGLTLPDARPAAVATDDDWTAGFTPSLVAVVWRGPGQDAAPSGASGRAWHDFMAAAAAGTPVREFPPTGAPTPARPQATEPRRAADPSPRGDPPGLSAPAAIPAGAGSSSGDGTVCTLLSPCG